MYDCIIVGAGTAGLSAAIYCTRAGLNVLVYESAVYGGQIINALDVQNYPGVAHTSGFAFATSLHDQAVALGTQIQTEAVQRIATHGDFLQIEAASQTIDTKTVILATGAKHRTLDLADEQRLIGAGVSYCATCDGAFFRDKDVAVVGGGSTAVEDALFLSKTCKSVTLIHRRTGFRAPDATLPQLRAQKNVRFLLDTTVTALHGDTALESITVEHVQTKDVQTIAVQGIFVAVGQVPANAQFSPPVALDAHGYIIAGENCKTNVPGVFAAGDCRTKVVRQLVTAAADGAVAATAAAAFMHQHE